MRALGFSFLCALALGLAQAKPLTVVTSFTIIADIAQNVAGDDAKVVSITEPGAEIHEYEPTPQDLLKAQQADLILWNGLNLENWFKRFLEPLGDKPSVVVTQGIEAMMINEGSYQGLPNPHAWMSIENGKIYTRNIANALAEHDPEHAAAYQQRASAYIEQLEALKQPLQEALQSIPEQQRWLVSSEGAFSYLARDFNLREAYIWPINAEQQGTPQQIRAVIETVKQHRIPVVFSESTLSDKPAKQVAKESGARYGGVLYVDSLSAADGPVPTYLDLLRVTTHTIAEAFKE